MAVRAWKLYETLSYDMNPFLKYVKLAANHWHVESVIVCKKIKAGKINEKSFKKKFWLDKYLDSYEKNDYPTAFYYYLNGQDFSDDAVEEHFFFNVYNLGLGFINFLLEKKEKSIQWISNVVGLENATEIVNGIGIINIGSNQGSDEEFIRMLFRINPQKIFFQELRHATRLAITFFEKAEIMKRKKKKRR